MMKDIDEVFEIKAYYSKSLHEINAFMAGPT